jgi:hypothetical protein
MLGPRQAIYRASSGGVELRLRVNPDAAWIVIRAPGFESRYFDIPNDQVGAVTAFFPAEGDSPEKFKSFVNAIESQMRPSVS